MSNMDDKLMCYNISRRVLEEVLFRLNMRIRRLKTTTTRTRVVQEFVLPSENEILACAMAIVNHTNEKVGTDVVTRQRTNDPNFDFAIARIRELAQVAEYGYKEQQ